MAARTVQMGPGLTQLVLMPLVDISMLASALVKDTMAPFVAT